ncbi:alkaline phosphatase family protein [Chitinophaga qingshengii]|uniref:Alkaline phosphatase family protein n=1 Tax=Chitinophaga qingshengii TaxID=1569794 RepID=A0ABR7TND2_9BACT|nr:alkaline phosphatase family protein [Chitinophaga qingshengii]MBC9932003.1 alkaline phosphatase family protein [Chitinophaga qingshengii]
MLKKIILSVLTFSCTALIVQAQQKKALFIIVDGIPADVIEKQPTPHLHNIAKAGGYTRAYVGGEKGGYSQTPTISAVGYNSLLTGTWVNKHNVWDNDIAAQNYSYGSIFRFFKQTYPQKKTAIFSSWQDNRTKLVGDGLPQTGQLKIDYHVDGLEKDTVRFPHDKDSWYMHLIDEEVVNNAADYVRKEAPDLTWVYLEYTDDMGHRYGDSEKFYAAVKMMDDQVGRIWDALEYRRKNFGEEWQIFITTDHGRTAETGKGHGGQSDRERTTWMVTNAKGLNDYFKKGQPGIVDILPTMARFMNINIPLEDTRELDGVPLTGKISLTHPGATLENGSLQLTWKAAEKKGKVKIWVTTTNHFNTGGHDTYKLLGEVPLQQEQANIPVKDMPSGFYKVVMEGPDNMVNRWVGKEK